MAGDDQEKTEDPTQRRLEDAKKKGQIAFSREVSNFFMILSLALVIGMIMPWLLQAATELLRKYISSSHELEVTSDGFSKLGVMILKDVVVLLGFPLLLFVFAAIAASMIQNGFHISTEPIMPKMEKISVIKGLKRMFSMRSFMEFIKGLIKISIVGYVAYAAVSSEFSSMSKTASMDSWDLMRYIGKLTITILINCCIALFFIAIIDFMYQKFEFMKQMRMSKQEIKEEYKQQEGDPHIKGKLKQIRMEKARRRMMAAVPTADVVVSNPTHYAIALKYDTEKSRAPVVVAMGIDDVAEKIKEIAKENKVPEVRNPVLARALYADCELDTEIPFAHYQTVAEVISYVYKLKRKGPK